MALKFGIILAKRSCNRKSMSYNLAFMPVANKAGQNVKKFIFRLFSEKYNRLLTKSGNKPLF